MKILTIIEESNLIEFINRNKLPNRLNETYDTLKIIKKEIWKLLNNENYYSIKIKQFIMQRNRRKIIKRIITSILFQGKE